MRLPPACHELNRKPPPTELMEDAEIAAVARALGNPHRVHIVRYLSECKPHIELEVAEELGLAQSTVSEHIRKLREVGILLTVEDPPRTWYCIDRGKLAQFARSVAAIPVPFDRLELGSKPA